LNIRHYPPPVAASNCLPRGFRRPDAVVPLNPMVFDPEAAHVPDVYDQNHPDATLFQRSTPPDPTRGLTVDDVESEQGRTRGSARDYRPDEYEGDLLY
jgi:hypothetical protein